MLQLQKRAFSTPAAKLRVCQCVVLRSSLLPCRDSTFLATHLHHKQPCTLSRPETVLSIEEGCPECHSFDGKPEANIETDDAPLQEFLRCIPPDTSLRRQRQRRDLADRNPTKKFGGFAEKGRRADLSRHRQQQFTCKTPREEIATLQSSHING